MEVGVDSFGCSFVWGTDLHDCPAPAWPDQTQPIPSAFTWPSLIAKKIGRRHRCWAMGGAGNLSIADRVMSRIKNRISSQQILWIINWTYIDRFDVRIERVIDNNRNVWDTILPNQSDVRSEYYFKHIHDEVRDKFANLMYIYSVIQALTLERIPFVMTYMDPLLLCDRYPMPAPVVFLQDQVRPYLHDFEGLDFLNWSRQQGFAISADNHPLEQAHEAAADLMWPVIDAILHKA
jgi:hypothetical protein